MKMFEIGLGMWRFFGFFLLVTIFLFLEENFTRLTYFQKLSLFLKVSLFPNFNLL